MSECLDVLTTRTRAMLHSCPVNSGPWGSGRDTPAPASSEVFTIYCDIFVMRLWTCVIWLDSLPDRHHGVMWDQSTAKCYNVTCYNAAHGAFQSRAEHAGSTPSTPGLAMVTGHWKQLNSVFSGHSLINVSLKFQNPVIISVKSSHYSRQWKVRNINCVTL